MRIDIVSYHVIASALVKLQKENLELKKKIKEMELQKTSSNVADRIDEWLNQPYHEKSEREDINTFADEITRFVDNELKT